MYATLESTVVAVKSLNSTGDALKLYLLNIVKNTSTEANGALTVFYGEEIDNVGTGLILDKSIG